MVQVITAVFSVCFSLILNSFCEIISPLEKQVMFLLEKKIYFQLETFHNLLLQETYGQSSILQNPKE